MSFIPLADAKTFLKIDPSDTSQDLFLQSQLDIICEAVEAYCRRTFGLANVVQTFYADDENGGLAGKEIALYMWPVQSVSSITVDGSLVTDYRVNLPKGYIVRSVYGAPGWIYSYDSQLVVTYIAGFPTIPNPIRHVVLSLVQQNYNRSQMGIPLSFGSDVQSISIPKTISIAFDYTLDNNDRSVPFGTILGNFLNTLDYYRSERAVMGSGRLEYTVIS